MIDDGSLFFKAVSFDGKPWYEIDTLVDLTKAEQLFLAGNYTARKSTILPQSNILDIPVISAVTSTQKTTGILNDAKYL
jgi:hypothetical protein